MLNYSVAELRIIIICAKVSNIFFTNKYFNVLFFILVAFYYPTHTIKPLFASS